MFFDQFFKRDAHFFFDNARIVDVPRDRKQFGARVIGAPDAREPAAATAQNCRHNGDRLHVVDRRRAAIKTGPRREWRLHARHPFFALEAFQQGGFFAADIGACAVGQIDVEVPAGFAGIFAHQTCRIGLVNRVLQGFAFADIFATNVDVAGVGIHRERRDQAAFDQSMRIMAHDFTVFAGARLGFVGIDHKVAGAAIAFLGHERPFQTGREPRTATATQARGFHFVHDPVAALFDDSRGAIPVPTRLCALQRAVVHPVEVGENPVLVLEH